MSSPYQPYPPHETARADQLYAEVAHELDMLIDAYRCMSDGLERARVLDLLSSTLANPSKGDGEQISHSVHVGTLANVLTVAIDRLAKAGAQ